MLWTRMARSESPDTRLLHSLVRRRLALLCIYSAQRLRDRVHTVGSLNADILRYNADNLSITLKLWGKLDENVSWVNTFSSHSSISLHFTRQNIAYRVATVSTLATASMLSTHKVLSRGNGCHKRATTLILWGRRQFWGNFRFQPG